jgi:hypothetical protein
VISTSIPRELVVAEELDLVAERRAIIVEGIGKIEFEVGQGHTTSLYLWDRGR